MENKNLPENGHENLNPVGENLNDEILLDEDYYLPAEEGELSDDDLDISELLSKYLPDFASGDDNAKIGGDEQETILSDILIGGNATVSPVDENSEEFAVQNDCPTEEYETSEEYISDETQTYEDESEEYTEDFSAEYTEYGTTELSEVEEDGEYTEDEVYDEAEVEDYSEYSFAADDASYEETVSDEENQSGEELEIPDDTELDATDINLMVAFGLDDELAKTMGPEVAAKLAEEIDAEAKEHEEKIRRSVENEYIDPSQTPSVAAALKRRFSHLKVKIFFASILTLLLLLYENLEIFGVQFGGALNPAVYPVVYIMMSLQIMLLCAAAGYEQLLGGCADLFKGRMSPSSIAFVVNVAAVVYSVVLAETTVLPNEPTLFNVCAASMTLFALVYDYLTTKRNILSFNIISSKRPKYAVRYMTAEEAGIPGGLFEDDDVAEGGVLRIEKTKFVDDFFATVSGTTKSGRGYSTAYVFISAIAAAIIGVYAGMNGDKSSVSALNAAFVTFFATMPLSLFFSMAYPFYKGVSNAYDLDGTVLGETSAEAYSEAGAVCFDDVDAFPSYGVKVQNIKIYNNHRIDRVLYYAASAFKVAGGPLSDVFEVATMEIGTSENVFIQSAAEGFLSVLVDDKSIIFGRAESLREYGINLPDSVTEEDDTLSSELCPMYMIREGKLMAKLLVRYMLDSDFEFLLKDLSDEGMCACIKTFDPNIDDELVTMKLGGGRYPFRVLRYNDADEINKINERMSSGIVSRGTTKSLLGIIGSCSKMLGMRKAGFTVGVVSAVIATLIVWLLIASGGFASVGSIAIIVYQLLWALPVVFAARIFLR